MVITYSYDNPSPVKLHKTKNTWKQLATGFNDPEPTSIIKTNLFQILFLSIILSTPVNNASSVCKFIWV